MPWPFPEELQVCGVIISRVQIDRIRVVTVPMEVIAPLKTSGGVHGSRNGTLIEITDSQGIVGWGENVAPDGVDYVGESKQDSIAKMREHLIAELVMRDCVIAEMNPSTWWGIEGFQFAKHALESALWDVHARAQNTSVKNLLGGTRDTIAPGVVVGLSDTIDEVIAECFVRINQGYRRIKLKITLGHDVEVVRQVRNAIGDEFVLQVDANGSYTSDHKEHLNQLGEFNLQFIEQPFAVDNIEAHIQFSQSGSVPVCMDESISSSVDLVKMLDLGACSVVNIKPSRVGGIGEAVVMHDIVLSRGVDAWVGGMLETGIGRASCLAVASMPGFTLTPDLSASNRYFLRDVTVPFELHNGVIDVPDSLGIGRTPTAGILTEDTTIIETVFER